MKAVALEHLQKLHLAMRFFAVTWSGTDKHGVITVVIAASFDPTGIVLYSCRTMVAAVTKARFSKVRLQWETTARSGFIVISQHSCIKCDWEEDWTLCSALFFSVVCMRLYPCQVRVINWDSGVVGRNLEIWWCSFESKGKMLTAQRFKNNPKDKEMCL